MFYRATLQQPKKFMTSNHDPSAFKTMNVVW